MGDHSTQVSPGLVFHDRADRWPSDAKKLREGLKPGALSVELPHPDYRIIGETRKRVASAPVVGPMLAPVVLVARRRVPAQVFDAVIGAQAVIVATLVPRRFRANERFQHKVMDKRLSPRPLDTQVHAAVAVREVRQEDAIASDRKNAPTFRDAIVAFEANNIAPVFSPSIFFSHWTSSAGSLVRAAGALLAPLRPVSVRGFGLYAPEVVRYRD